MSLLIHGATVVTALYPPAVTRADIHVEGDRVAAIAPGLAVAAPLLDATGCLVVPGNVNAHMHAYSALARGMPYRLAPPANFVQILQRVWWRLDRALDADTVRASALVAARDALLAGTTTLVDHHASPNAIDGVLDILADAFAQVGIRSVLAYEVTDRDGRERAAAGLAENARFLRRVAAGRAPLARAMVGAHASFTLSDRTLADCVALATRSGVGLHIHVAEDVADEEDALARSGQRTVERLDAAGALDAHSLVAHAVHVDGPEAEVLRNTGATIAHNPRSNMNNAVGRAPLALLGERVALGTDGLGADMWAEGQLGYFRRHEEAPLTAADWPLAHLATGARLAGDTFGEPLLGRLEVGAPADLVVLDYAPPTPLHAHNLAGHWLYGIAAANVRDVVVGGELVVRDRRLTRVDEVELSAGAQAAARHLWARLEDIGAHPFEPQRRALATSGSERWPR
jgi:putative selenium metabolism protein SsnA